MSEPNFSKEELVRIQKAARQMEKQVRRGMACGVCDRPADGVGVFVPTDPDFAKKIGRPEDKMRFVLYPSCSACQAKLGMDEYMKRVELVMQAEKPKGGKA